MNVLKLENVQQVFEAGTENEHQALKNINLTLAPGEFVTIIGGNGAGKSTLLSTIAGLMTPTSGTVELLEKNLRHYSPLEKAQKISRVFQDPKLGSAANLSIEENLTLASLRGSGKKLTKALKKENQKIFQEQVARLNLDLESRLKMKMGLLSGGQRQALTLLMATIKAPELLLLDEHTAALDPKTAKVVMELTCQLIAEKQLTAFMVTHNIKDAIQYGNRLLMLNQGEVILDLDESSKKALTPKEVMDLFSEKAGQDLGDQQILSA